jgi:hypothetical protein
MSVNRARIGTIGALTASLVLSGAAVIGANLVQRDDPTIRPSTRPAYAMVPPLSAGVLTSSGSLSEAPTPGKIGTATGPISIRYTFDGGVDQPITDDRGGHRLRPLGQNGGTLSLVPQGPGLAVEYPRRCKLIREGDCPRAILEGSRDDRINPGTRPVRYGASVRMTRADLSDGANVLQKGYSVGAVSQFKLQVDHRQGHPSCVITGDQANIYRAEPNLDVADGTWHNLTCVRSRTRLTIVVDGVQRQSVALPAALSIANAEPLRIGGKGPSKGNDQFAGEIDNVFLTIF